jgi:AraC-like DNA-binding protein
MEQVRKTYEVRRIRPGLLGRFINWFTIYHFYDDVPLQMYPEGYFELVFQVGSNFFQNSNDTGEWKKRPMQFIGGLHNKSYSIKPERKHSMLISVNFKPNSARYFIPEKLQLFKNKLVSLDDVFKRSELGRVGEMYGWPNTGMTIRLIEEFLSGIFIERSDSRIDFVLDTIMINKGFVNMKDLAANACLSHSQFRRRFKEEIGMSPKEYSKIVRIKNVSEILSQKPNLKLTELAYEFGYYDQAHFIKDFKSVMGTSPKHFRS